MNVISSLKYFLPELFLTGLVLLAVLMDLLQGRKKNNSTANVIIIGLLFIMILVLSGGNENHSLFFGTVALDSFARFFKLIAAAAAVFTVWSVRYSNSLKEYNTGEFNSILLMIVLGIFILASATDLLMVYLGFELLSMLSYILTAYLLKDRKSNEAGLKYIIYGAFSSGIMLFGLSWIYGLTGSLRIDSIHYFLNTYTMSPLPVYIAMLMILVGLSYKIAAVPFHFWSPDVYEGAPTSFTAFLSTAPKAAGFAIIIRLFSFMFSSENAMQESSWESLSYINWPMLIAVMSAATMTLGNLVALQQKNVKRLLAYSSIAHAGYMMMGLVVVNHDGIFAVLFYLGVYLFMNMGAFLIAVFVANYAGHEDIDDFTSLGYRSPLVAVLMTLFLFSLTGLPPTAGFIGKFYLFAALIKSQSQWLWLAVVGILNSVISLYYYAGVIKQMYIRDENIVAQPIPVSNGFAFMLILLIIPVILFGIYWAPLQSLVASSLQMITL